MEVTMTHFTRFFIILFSFFLFSCVRADQRSAENFDLKTKPIQVVIPFAPGGGVDQTFRHLQKYAAERGVTMIGIYKPGAEGLISMSELVTMPNDGYHISVSTAAVVSYYRARNPSTDVIPITSLRDSIMTVVVNSKSTINNINDLENQMITNPTLSFGYGAPGQKMFFDQFFELSKIQKLPLMVPYKGGGPVVNDLLGGHINAGVVPYSIAKSHIDAGKLKVVTFASRLPMPELNNVKSIKDRYPTWKEFDGFLVILEKNTDPKIIKIWSDFLKQYMGNSAVQKDFLDEYTVPSEFGQDTAEKIIKASTDRLKRLNN